jgi:uncharacterized protein (TIGR02147 family)
MFRPVVTETPYYIQLIRERLSKKQRLNASYSLRAFSRNIGMNSSTLSQVLNGKRPFPSKNFDKIATALHFSPLEKMRFVDSLMKRRPVLDSIPLPKEDTRHILDESYYRVIAEWEHYAVLTLLDVDGFRLTAGAVAKRLGLTPNRAETVIQNLLDARLIHTVNGKLLKSHQSVRTTEDISSQALKESHVETLEIGKTKLQTIPVNDRDFSSINFACDPSQITELKIMIREFRGKVLSIAKSGKRKSEVFQLALQLYPLTHPLTKEKSK